MNALDVLKVVVDRYPGPGMTMVGQDALARVEAVVEAARRMAPHPAWVTRTQLDALAAALAASDLARSLLDDNQEPQCGVAGHRCDNWPECSHVLATLERADNQEASE